MVPEMDMGGDKAGDKAEGDKAAAGDAEKK